MIIYAVDDEPILLDKLNKAIMEAEPEAQLFSFPNSSALMKAIKGGTPLPDAAFLDIEMPGIDGIELAKQLKVISPKTWIIFVTGFSQYAVEAMRIHANGYITKPVTAQRIKEELNAPCPVPLKENSDKPLKVQCFGNFEAFVGDEPLKFDRTKSKELLAYLIDRRGSAVNTAELCAILWENQPDTISQRNYFRKLVTDLSKTLEKAGVGEAFIKSRNSFAVNTNKIDCDYYRFLNRDPDAINAYKGEYMTQYSWSEFTLSELSEL